MLKTFADKVITFNRKLAFKGNCPPEFKVLNPFSAHEETMVVVEQFYKKYYNDTHKRRMMLGINPGRHGAAITGIPFTDTKRLEHICGIKMESASTHEVSSVFVYDMIAAYGGADQFYSDFYINSPFPLAIIRQNKQGNWVNANYYDDAELYASLKSYMIESMKKHIAVGIDTSKAFILGKKNAKFIHKMNEVAGLFDELVVLDHPRYIQQYKFKQRDKYIGEYVQKLTGS